MIENIFEDKKEVNLSEDQASSKSAKRWRR
jgi:hypothetical protein